MKKILLCPMLFLIATAVNAQIDNYSWKFYRPGNTGIQGDMATALWIDSNGNPYIAANTGNWGEGGFAKFNLSQNKWENFSNVDLPVLGSFDNGDIQILDFVSDAENNLWMAKATGALKYNPAIGSTSILSFDADNSPLQGFSYDIDLAPDGTIWFANSELIRYEPNTDTWTSLGGSNIRMSVQPKPDGSYIVWSGDTYYGPVIQYNSLTNTATTSMPSNVGDIAGLPGKDCVDDSGNFWALRFAADGAFETLEYQKPNGDWVYPVHPYSNLSFYIDAFKAFGNKQAVLVTTVGEVWRFDGTNWINYGTWRPGQNNTSIDIDANGNVWVCGLEGAAKRDSATGIWQRYRLTNTSQIDYFVEDITFDISGNVWMTGNAGTGVGGIQKFDGTNWNGFNPYTYGLGNDFPFDADNATAISYRPLSNKIAFSPTFHGVHTWNGTNYATLDSEMTTSKGLVEDSLGRLWSLDEYFNFRLYDDIADQWTDLPIVGWGSKIVKDPTLPGSIWATTEYELQRTNGTEVLSFTIDDFPDLSGVFTGFAIGNGMLWTGTWLPSQSNGSSLIKYNTYTGLYQSWSYDNGWPFPGEHVRPFAVTPDGNVWMQYDSEYPSTDSGILSYDGTNVSVFPAAIGGFPDWNILPNSNIKEVEVKELPDGYELWISCLGRGIAVLKVTTSILNANSYTNNILDAMTVFPNPASDQVTMSFTNTNPEKTEITVYDLSGRLIETLVDNQIISGDFSLVWDAGFSKGLKYESGIYIINLKTETKNINTKLVLK